MYGPVCCADGVLFGGRFTLLASKFKLGKKQRALEVVLTLTPTLTSTLILTLSLFLCDKDLEQLHLALKEQTWRGLLNTTSDAARVIGGRILDLTPNPNP